MELIEKLQKIIEREIDNVPMVLTDPLTLRRLRAERLAQAALTALIEHVGGDGVTEGDREAGRALVAAMFDPDLDPAGVAVTVMDHMARHRATAFAAGKAARGREIAKEVERELALTSLANIENASADWIAGFEHAQRRAMAAIERGEV